MDARSRPMDFWRKISHLTLDVINHIGFGEPFSDLRADADVDGFLEAGVIWALGEHPFDDAGPHGDYTRPVGI